MMKKILFVLMGLVLFSASVSFAANEPYLISFQGKLEGVTSPVNITFKLFTALTGGTQKWSETISAVPLDSNGIFNVLLGQTNAFGDVFFANPSGLWMEIAVEGTALSPRQALTAAPYAFVAKKVKGESTGRIVDASSSGGTPIFGQSTYATLTPWMTAIGAAGGVVGAGDGMIGVVGISTKNYGVYGRSSSSWGIFGTSEANNSAGVVGQSPLMGVLGISTQTTIASPWYFLPIGGVAGMGDGAVGVSGASKNNYGVYGLSTNAVGVGGIGKTAGGSFEATALGGRGVYGKGTWYGGYFESGERYGVYAESSGAYAAMYALNTNSVGAALEIYGNDKALSLGSGTISIDSAQPIASPSDPVGAVLFPYNENAMRIRFTKGTSNQITIYNRHIRTDSMIFLTARRIQGPTDNPAAPYVRSQDEGRMQIRVPFTFADNDIVDVNVLIINQQSKGIYRGIITPY